MSAETAGKVICVGLGPGDPDLVSLRSYRTLQRARHVAYFCKRGAQGNARTIVAGMLAEGVTEHPMEYPVTTEIPFSDPGYNRLLAAFYDEWADHLARLAQTEDVAVLCEGDPYLYGSFMHLQIRLQGHAEIEVIPGITGMSGCWTATGRPITWGDDVLTVLPATLPENELARRAGDSDALVVMKIGRNLAKLKRALTAAGRLDAAWLIERGTMPEQRIGKLSEAETAPYFSLVVIHGQGRRP